MKLYVAAQTATKKAICANGTEVIVLLVLPRGRIDISSSLHEYHFSHVNGTHQLYHIVEREWDRARSLQCRYANLCITEFSHPRCDQIVAIRHS